MLGFPVDFTKGVGESDFTIPCVIELEEERLGRKLSPIEIQQINNCYYHENMEEDPQINT